jgi:hypothetical protein
MSKSVTKQPMSSEVWGELHSLKNIVALAAFAADARRTLEGIAEVRRWYPDINERINDRVTASNNWDVHEDTLSAVLAHVNDRLHDLLTAEEGAE